MVNIIKRLNRSDRRERAASGLFVMSLHKSGTHLINHVLEQLSLKMVSSGPGTGASAFRSLEDKEYVWSHHNPGQDVFDLIETGEVKAIFHFRDPRDVVVSRFHWQHPDNTIVTNVSREFMKKVHARFKDDQDFLQFIIRGEMHAPHEISFVDQYRLSRGLLFHPNVFKTNFETLVGSKGGGSDAAQIKMIGDLLNYLELDDDAQEIGRRAYSTESVTFDTGQIGRYKEVFSEETEHLFQKLHGDLLKDYGYS